MACRWDYDSFVCLLQSGQTLHVKTSVGIALSLSDSETAALLIKHADKAMHKAKGTAQQVVLFRQLNDSILIKAINTD